MLGIYAVTCANTAYLARILLARLAPAAPIRYHLALNFNGE